MALPPPLATEKIPPEEEKYIRDLRQRLQEKIEKEYPKGIMRRDAHPKMHGLVRAYFIIEPDLPPDLRVGVFRDNRRYKAWIRFSNQSGTIQPDIKNDIRGMSIKVLGIPGEKLLEDEPGVQTHDFILISTDVFVTANVKEFAEMIKALTSNVFSIVGFFLTHWRVAYNLWHSMLKFANPLHINYFSTTPYLFGDKAVKYGVFPSTQTIDTLPAQPKVNFLRDAMVAQLSHEDAVFDFCIQIQTDAVQMPIEDPGKVWPESMSPFKKVATIRIPRQNFHSELQREYGENMSFSPWRALPQHRPLGGINRARKVVYDAISKFRHAHNHVPREEPTSWEIPGMDLSEQQNQNSRFQWGNTTTFQVKE
ncbi:catalase family protein [Undibacterium sp. RuRC25W]|uniref:catalase family protein n=1 Tax=Undibacterium sp. RuRC25W TaxID=3413047 RepID=UPI003BF06F3B